MNILEDNRQKMGDRIKKIPKSCVIIPKSP